MNLMKTETSCGARSSPYYSHSQYQTGEYGSHIITRSIAAVCIIGVSDILSCEQSFTTSKKDKRARLISRMVVVEAVAVSVFLCVYIPTIIIGD